MRESLYDRLAAVAASLTVPTTREELEAHASLDAWLAQTHRRDLEAIGARELPIERTTVQAGAHLPPDRRARLTEVAARAERDGQLPRDRVFRREAPLVAASLDLTTPAWGRGAGVSRTIGPLSTTDGRRVWFDFYAVTRLVPVYLGGNPQPALLFSAPSTAPESGQPPRPADTISLGPGSLWVHASLLTTDAPAGTYVGLRVGGGALTFTPRPATVAGRLTIPAGGRCSAELRLTAATPDARPRSGAGSDAASAAMSAPATLAFDLSRDGISLTRVGEASWTVYGAPAGFTWRGSAAPAYEHALHAIVVPLDASVRQIAVGTRASPFATVEGEGRVVRAGWVLPVAAIDIEHPTDAAGSGGLAIRANSDLTVSWRGLRDGPIRLPSPWIVQFPGTLLIADPAASNLYASQRFRLWQDAGAAFRSELSLRYTDAFPLIYASDASGSEVVLTAADAEARLDRPVDVSGTPFPVRTLASLMLLVYTDAARFVLFYEDDILADSLDPQATWPIAPGEAVALAIRNALFTITPVNSLFLFATLLDEEMEMVEQGSLLLAMGLYGVLPTLPDPYAARVGLLRRRSRTDQRAQRPTLLLVAAVVWTKASDEEADEVETSFAFAPLGSQTFFAAWQAPPAPPPPGPIVSDWDLYFGPFEREQFALLDVSTNADQMGVSFAWFNPATISDAQHIFYQVYAPESAEPPPPPIPVAIRDLDLAAESRHVRAFTVPQISWEPLVNLTPPGDPALGIDPPLFHNLYPDDGGPTRLFNDSVALVPIAPIPVTELLVQDFDERSDGFTGALFTLPFGLRAFAEIGRENQFLPALDPAALSFNRPEYEDGALRGGLQLRTDAPPHPAESPIFRGGTLQLDNVLRPDGTLAFAGTLGASVGAIFNGDFFFGASTGYKPRGVPLTRIDFSGYGASIFSHWQNPNAAIAETSQARFDVFIGRTGHEVIQVRSLLYPWGVQVVRTINIDRASSANVYRFDTGWQAESDGVYDFRWSAYDAAFARLPQDSPYEVHPGVVHGLFRIRNIRETSDTPAFQAVWHKQDGDEYVDDKGILRFVDAATDPAHRSPAVTLQPVYFDADVAIDGVVAGARNGRVPSKRMLGYVQIAPKGQPLPPEILAQLLNAQFGSLGGPVDCVIDIGESGQLMRLSRVDVNVAQKGGGGPIFVAAARGALVLPKDGAWSVVQHTEGTGEVAPLDAAATVPLIRRGALDPETQTTDAVAGDLLRIAHPLDLVKPADATTRHLALLQSTDTQKALFRRPRFAIGVDELVAEPPDFADAYRILNSAGIFPNVQDALPLNLGSFSTRIVEAGYRLIDQADPDAIFEQVLPPGPLYLINEEFLKLYIEYAKKDKNEAVTGVGRVRYGFDATAADAGRRWLSKVNDIGMVVDLGPLKRLMMIKGRFDAEKGADPAFMDPELEFSDALEPVIDILQVLLMLQGGDYKAALQKGLEIAMSNSADAWSYAFRARKEIPLVKFPPGIAYDNPTNALKLECRLAVGVYFNEALALPGSPGQLVPSAGAFLEFGGRIAVMCVSVGGATLYATGSVDLRTSADIKTGPSLYMKFGFGAEIVVGLPVIGSVSLLYMVGVEISLSADGLEIGAFLLFRGRAEILGGIVTVTIMIEAKGTVKRLGSPERTDIIAQVTFGLNISIFLVINIKFKKSWKESRQIAD